MTLGTYPEKLTLGYLRNQRLIDDINEIAEVRVDWDRETVDVSTSHGDGIVDLHEKIAKRTVTCLLYTSPSPRDRTRSRMPSSA